MSVNGIVPHILMMPTQKGSGAGDYQQSKTPGSRSVHIPTSPEQVHALLQTCLFFCFAINILTALGAVQHVLCDCYADKIFCEFSPHQCFSFGLSQLGSLPSKMDCFDQSIWWFDGWHGIKSSNAFFQLLCAVAIFNPTVGSLRGSSWSRSSFEICYLLVKIWRQLHQQSRDANIDLNSTETNVGQQN